MNNRVANWIKNTGIGTWIVGFIVGIIIGNEISYSFMWSTAITYWLYSFIIGMVFFGFAEIIELLEHIHSSNQDIQKKNYYMYRDLSDIKSHLTKNE